MTFQPGHKLAKGRPVGSRNRRTEDFLAVLEANNFCPASAMIECYQEARKIFDNYGVIYDAITDARVLKNDIDGSFSAPAEDKAHIYLKIAADMAKELASYAHPKLKSIEKVRTDPLEDMTPEQKLEAMKSAVKMLEAQVKARG